MAWAMAEISSSAGILKTTFETDKEANSKIAKALRI